MIVALLLAVTTWAGPSDTPAAPDLGDLDLQGSDVRSAHSSLAAEVVAAPMARGRGGSLRVVGGPTGPEAAVVHLHLALFGAEAEEVRAARVRASILDAPRAWRAAVWSSPEPRLRAAGVAGLAQDPTADQEIARVARQDADASVREVAVSTLSRMRTGGAFGSTYAALAGDSEPRVRALAIRALGWWQIAAEVAVVERALADVAPTVREAAAAARARLP